MFRNFVKRCSPIATRYLIKPKHFITSKPERLSIYSQNVIKFGGPVSIRIQEIHVSTPVQALHPILVFVLRPVTKFLAILFGRGLRKWWQKLTPEERKKVKKRIESKQTYIAAGFFVFVGFVWFYYIEHLQEDPVTKRKRFILFNDEQMKIVAKLEFETQVKQFRPDVVPVFHPIYRRVGRVATRILEGNDDIDQIRSKQWGITVIDRPEITNAFVLPDGKIFVFSGMLNTCTNDDQLAIVLSHEIAHAICSHNAESMSRVIYLDIFLIISSVILWFTFSDLMAFFSQWITNSVANILFHFPFSRKLEKEADIVGLKLAAKACFDVREAPVFWAKMKIVNESPVPVEWLSTHPSHETRQIELRELVPKALKVREASHCPLLGPLSKTSKFYGYMT